MLRLPFTQVDCWVTLGLHCIWPAGKVLVSKMPTKASWQALQSKSIAITRSKFAAIPFIVTGWLLNVESIPDFHFQIRIHHLQSFLRLKRDVKANIVAQFNVANAHWEHRMRPHAKATWNASQLEDHCGGWIIQARDYYCFGSIRYVWIHLEYQQTREERWEYFEARETIRNTIKQLHSIRTIRTRTHNSIQFGRRDISTYTQTRKHRFIICKGKRGRRMEANIRSLTMLLCIHSQGPNTQSYYRRPHNLGSSFWEYISKCCESEVLMSDVYLFLLELRKSIIYFGGSIIQDNGHNVVREHLLLLARI